MDNQELKQYVQKAVDSLTRETAEKDLRKTLAEDVKDKFDIKPAEFNKMAKIAFDLYEAKEKLHETQELIDKAESLGF